MGTRILFTMAIFQKASTFFSSRSYTVFYTLYFRFKVYINHISKINTKSYTEHFKLDFSPWQFPFCLNWTSTIFHRANFVFSKFTFRPEICENSSSGFKEICLSRLKIVWYRQQIERLCILYYLYVFLWYFYYFSIWYLEFQHIK